MPEYRGGNISGLLFLAHIGHQNHPGAWVAFSQRLGYLAHIASTEANHRSSPSCLPAGPCGTDTLADIRHATVHQFANSEPPPAIGCPNRLVCSGLSAGLQTGSNIGQRNELQAR